MHIKPIVFGLIALCLAASVALATVRGDANCDGRTTAADVTAIVTSLGNAPGECAGTDVDGDDAVTDSDLQAELSLLFDPVEEFVAQASDFACLTTWSKVRHYRVSNALGHLEEALDVANLSADVSGQHFPVGTIIQLIPTEAMVKRGGDFDPDNNDWEYFSLRVNSRGTQIAKRGRDEVTNFQGANCFNCHSAARTFDFVCETTHGCIQLGISDELVNLLQSTDPRCR